MTVNSYVPIYSGDPTQFGRVAVLFGGNSAERSVSLKSGQHVFEALQSSGVDAIAIDVGENICQQLSDAKFDCAFIALHGGDGEGGKVQALLDLMGVRYTGSSCAASALAMNKLHTKKVWLSSGLPTAKFVTVSPDSNFEKVWEDIGDAFVKPAKEGSSYGVSPAHSLSELKAAVAHAREFDASVIVESLIDGPEYSVSILGNQVLPAIEIINHAEFYDFEAKYVSDKTEYVCPAKVSEQQATLMADYALAAFASLGCSGWGRVDFMADKTGELFLLEVNTVPGMTDHSLVPMAAKAVGLSYAQLVLEVLALSKVGDDG